MNLLNMATTKRPDSSQYPGGRQPRVAQPGQFIQPGPGQPQPGQGTQASTVPQGSGVRHVAVPAPARMPGYVDPALFAAGIFKDKADYDDTVKQVVARIKSGKVLSREPEVDDDDTPIKLVPKHS